MTDTNTDNSMIYVFLSVTILGALISIGTAVYFSLRCQRARGEIPPEPLREVVVISPAAALQVGQLAAERQDGRQHVVQQEEPLLSRQRDQELVAVA
jgi:hypothetical protein